MTNRTDSEGGGRARAWLTLARVCGLTAGLAIVAALAAGTTAGLTTPATARGAFTAHSSSGSGTIMFSLSSNRSRAKPLAGQTLAATRTIFVFVRGGRSISRVSFYIDNPRMSDGAYRVSSTAPYDLNGRGRHGSARGFDLGSLADIGHMVTAAITTSNGKIRAVSASFRIRSAGSHRYTKPLFDDEFTGPTLSQSNWFLYSGPGNAGRGLRDPSRDRVDGRGNLVITASMRGGQIVTGGMQSKIGYVYGHYEFRVKTSDDPANNMGGVAMAWPASQQVTDGEYDYYETGNQRKQVDIFLHHTINNGNSVLQDYYRALTSATRWHTIAADWQPGSITVYVDGVRVCRDTSPAVQTLKPHRIAIQLDPASLAALPRPVYLSVDYARFYQ